MCARLSRTSKQLGCSKMPKVTTLVLVAVAFMVLYCSEGKYDSKEGGWFFLPASGLRVLAPDPVEVRSLGGRDTLTLRPDTRQPVVLVLEPWNQEELSIGPALQLETGGGQIFRYRVQHRGGGSGGEVTSVTGSMRTANGVVSVSCTSQSEADQLESQCLGLIATLSES